MGIMYSMKTKTKNIILIIVGILLVAGLGSLFVNLGMDWFNALDKPTQWIPNIVIPIVWTVIYALFGIVLIAWNKKGDIPKDVILWLIINGALNILWCLVFFTLNQTFLGNIVIILNLIAGIVLWLKIYKTQPVYATVLSLYPIWLSIATTLNLATWILN